MYSKIDAEIWHDDKLRALHEDARWLFHYLLTSPHRNSIGFYRLPLNYAIDDIQWPAKRFETALKILIDNNFVFWDAEKSIVLINKFLKWDPPKGPKQISGAISVLQKMPNTQLMIQFSESARKYVNDSLEQEIKKRLENISLQNEPNASSMKNEPQIKNSNQEDDKKITEFVDLYHQILSGNLPKIEKITDERKKKIKKILEEYSFEKITQVFENVKSSDFLCGRGSNGWKGCSFDWIIQNQKFVRILEGVYNQNKNSLPRGFQDIQDFLNSDEGGVINERE